MLILESILIAPFRVLDARYARTMTQRNNRRPSRPDHTARPHRRMPRPAPTSSREAHQKSRVAHPGRPRSGKPAPAGYVARVLILLTSCVLALLFVGVSISTCNDSHESRYADATLYQWENLISENGRFSYYLDGRNASRTGIDVSEHQGYIDWDSVARDDIDFAMVRIGNRGATSGALNIDDYAMHNLDGCQESGIECGAYFFSQAVSVEEAEEEADFVLATLHGRKLQMPIAYDHEPVHGVDGRADTLDDATLTACAKAFCDRIESAGYDSMVYGNASDLARFDDALRQRYGVWFAEYDVEHPSINAGFTIWQYSNAGSVSGVDTAVDLNIQFSS